jgi:predicted nuclease with TOPRIM domain
MLKLLGNFAKGVAKKKVKKKGGEMAQNIMGSKKDNAIVVREKKTTLAPISAGALDTSIQKPTTEGSPLDRIDSALLDIINTLKGRRKLMLDKSRMMRQQSDKEKKGKREGILERMKETGKKMVGGIVAGVKGWWEKLQTFLLMTLLGSLVVAIKENWEKIQAKIEETVTKVTELWKNLEPIVTPIVNLAKWIAVEGFKLIKPLFGMGKDKAEIEKGTNEVSEGLKKIDAEKSKLTGLFEKSVKDTEKLKDEDYSKDFKNLEKMESVDEENAGDDIVKVEQTIINVKDKISEIKLELDLPEFEEGAVPVPETGPAIVHKGEVIIPAPIVKMAGGTLKIENVINMMQTSTKQIKQNPLKVISIMETMAQEFAPMGEKLPNIINQTISESKLGGAPDKILEKMEKTLTIIKEQTDYEDPSATTIIIPVPTPSQPPMSGGGGGDAKVIPVGASSKDTLNRYMSAVIQKALY